MYLPRFASKTSLYKPDTNSNMTRNAETNSPTLSVKPVIHRAPMRSAEFFGICLEGCFFYRTPVEGGWSQSRDGPTGPPRGDRQNGQYRNRIGFWERLRWLFTDNREPRIYQRINRNGKIAWVAYDPLARKRYVFATEHNVRIWINRRYQHKI
jgi:hypothetical protein